MENNVYCEQPVKKRVNIYNDFKWLMVLARLCFDKESMVFAPNITRRDGPSGGIRPHDDLHDPAEPRLPGVQRIVLYGQIHEVSFRVLPDNPKDEQGIPIRSISAHEDAAAWTEQLNRVQLQSPELPAAIRVALKRQTAYNDRELIALHQMSEIQGLGASEALLMHALVNQANGLIEMVALPDEYLDAPDVRIAIGEVRRADSDLIVQWTDLSSLDGMDSALRAWFERGPVRVHPSNGKPARVEVMGDVNAVAPITDGARAFASPHAAVPMVPAVVPAIRGKLC